MDSISAVKMGRRRRKVIRVVKRTLPKVFGCPRCGVASVRVVPKNTGVITVACGNCQLKLDMPVQGKKEPIDVYNGFVDLFMAGKI